MGIHEFAERFRIRKPVGLLSQEQRRAIREVARGILRSHTPEALPRETAASLDRIARDSLKG